MKIKQFIIYSIIYIGVVGIVVFVKQSGSYTFELFGLNLTLPIAVWYMLPVAILVILAVLHMMYNGIGFYLVKRNFRSDANLYDDFAKELMLGFDSNKEFKTEFFSDPKELTRFLSPWGSFNYSPKLSNQNLSEVVEVVKKIKNGEAVELKKYRVSPDSKIFIQNEENKLKSDSKYAVQILKDKKGLYSENLSKQAYLVFLQNATFLDIKKFKLPENKDEIKILIDRYIGDESFEMSKEDLFTLLLKGDFSNLEYVEYVKFFKQKDANPQNLISFFERLKAQRESANEAYLYLLYEFGMIDELREALNYSEDKLDKFEILLFLKDSGKNISASYFY
ncbi:MAG: LapA family protein [Campylobacter sp.]|nr:LapA family protein [Campylobacter sp.]